MAPRYPEATPSAAPPARGPARVRLQPMACSVADPWASQPVAPLAGSACVGVARVAVIAGGALREDCALSALPPAARERLTRLRPPLCGLVLDRPRIMGILNVTPDSFSDGGVLGDLSGAVAAGLEMARHADILDIGGESTRPGAAPVPVAEELARTAPVIAALRAAGARVPISIDTRNAAVARAALAAGADMVNDVSALTHDPDMAAVVAEAGVPVCLMHAQGDPQTMQANPRYDDVVAEVLDWLDDRVAAAEAAGIARDRMVIDPGIGFGKAVAHNMSLLRALARFHDLGLAVLLGASRKRFIGALSGVDKASDRMAGSMAVALHGAGQGVQVVRVHDVAQTRQAFDMWQALHADGRAREQEQGQG